MGVSNSEHRAAITALTILAAENPTAREHLQLIRRRTRVHARLERLVFLADRAKDTAAHSSLVDEAERRNRELAHLADRIDATKPEGFDLAAALAELAGGEGEEATTAAAE